MVRIICRGALRYSWMRRLRLFHPSIECLQEISRKASHANKNEKRKLSEEFSLVLADLLIDGVWKKTGDSRLILADENLVDVLRHNMVAKIDFLDVGCSDGATSLNLMVKLKREFNVPVTGTLMDRSFKIVRERQLGLYVYYTKYGKPFFLRMGRIGLLLEELECKEATVFNPLVRLIVSFIMTKRYSTKDKNNLIISLINPALDGIDRLHFIENDVLHKKKSLINSFDVIRVSNVLNRGYFSDATISVAIIHLKEYLREAGLLLISRNVSYDNGEVENGTIWVKKEKKLVASRDIGEGSELKSMIDKHN